MLFIKDVVKASNEWCEGSVAREFSVMYGIMCDFNFDPEKTLTTCHYLLALYFVLTIVLLGFLIALYII